MTSLLRTPWLAWLAIAAALVPMLTIQAKELLHPGGNVGAGWKVTAAFGLVFFAAVVAGRFLLLSF
jgi:hypothetical protein